MARAAPSPWPRVAPAGGNGADVVFVFAAGSVVSGAEGADVLEVAGAGALEPFLWASLARARARNSSSFLCFSSSADAW
jgi:hypothetical protein